MLRSVAKIFRAVSIGSTAVVRGYEADIFAKAALNQGLATEDFKPLGLAAGVAAGSALVAHAVDKVADKYEQEVAEKAPDLEAPETQQEASAGNKTANLKVRASEGDLLSKKAGCCDDCSCGRCCKNFWDTKTGFVLLGAGRGAALTVATWAVAEATAPVVFAGALIGGVVYLGAEFVTKKCKGEKFGLLEGGRAISDFATNALAFSCLLKGGDINKIGEEFLSSAKTKTLDVAFRSLSGLTSAAAGISGFFYLGKAGKELASLKEDCKKDPEAYRSVPG